jgi:hypothetical protein
MSGLGLLSLEDNLMAPPQSLDVPIFVETPARSYFEMVRCSYMSIECDDPSPGWQIRLNDQVAPFLLLELVGIVQQPFGVPRFNTYNLVDQLFQQVEKQAFLLINFADIWLPSFLFSGAARVGDVYRVTNELFNEAFRFRDGQSNQQQFELRCKELPPVTFSTEETRAFGSWVAEQISGAQHSAPKNPELQLRNRPNDERPPGGS